MNETKVKKWNAAIYVRLSKDDGDKAESNSITNQKDLINEYLKHYDDIKIVTTKVDDGYSGVNFERPAFLEMMEEIKKGQVNCVVVKDLSRFGRNFEDTGKYLEQIFPFLGVRFISVNDRLDSTKKDSANDGLIIPFKNLINDAYCRDISIKIKSQLEIKRKKGEFIGAFATYGYLKGNQVDSESGMSKHKLVIDEYAALVVKDIFKWRISGQSMLRITEKLNDLGILSPAEYKKSIGLNFSTTFKVYSKSKWSENAVRRILTNEIYIGTLIQGKTGKPNHKIKKAIKKDRSEWDIIENNHEPIISKDDFYLVSEINKQDTRIAGNRETVYLLSGVLKCADCGYNMIRKSTTSKDKKYYYYVCVNNKGNNVCSSHSIKFELVEHIVERSVKNEIEKMVEVEKLFKTATVLPSKDYELDKLNKYLLSQQEELAKYERYKTSLIDKYVSDIITKDDYNEFKETYTNNIFEITESIDKIKTKINEVSFGSNEKNSLVESFLQYKNSKEISREMVITLIDEVLVYNDKSIEIKYKFSDEQRELIELDIASLKDSKEVVYNG